MPWRWPAPHHPLYLDLDGFKLINDLHGHDAGDELLRIVGARLARVVRSGDMVNRLSGDEFACLLVDMPDREPLRRLACKLFESVSAPLKIGRLKVSMRPSIGIATCPRDGTSADPLLRGRRRSDVPRQTPADRLRLLRPPRRPVGHLLRRRASPSAGCVV
jgi:diguanylate cyclase (GGDEF)-like protein